MDAWMDERLDDLAATLRPLPVQMARNTETIERMSDDMREMRKEMRTQFSALQRQLAFIGWTMAFSVMGVAVAVIIGT